MTAIAADPQRNLEFYTSVLGLRLVKKTVNFGDPGTYHLYYGDEVGRPGTILTFFPWPRANRGTHGYGQATVTAFSVPQGALGYWQRRLETHRVAFEAPCERFHEEVLAFHDPDGLKLELVAHDDVGDGEEGAADIAGGVPRAYAVRGFHGVTLLEQGNRPTVQLLTEAMGFRQVAAADPRLRFAAGLDTAGAYIDVVHNPEAPPGKIAVGTVHHVAWRVVDDDHQLAWRQRLVELGLDVTEVRDRKYFRSVYFREPGGVLFELATDSPGFACDESVEELGSTLKLPPWLEPQRAQLEQALPELQALK